MATTAPPRPPRRSSSVSTPSPPSSITRGATARSAVNPRVTSPLGSSSPRRSSIKAAASPHALNGDTRETLAASLKNETEQKEKLLVQLQNKEQTISNLATENDNISSALNSVETRLHEVYADQSRMEEELAARIEVAEKLRSQVRELEKEKRDVQRRYNEQTSTFEAERQAFYDNEQHLKSRIQSLMQTRKQPEPVTAFTAPESELEAELDEDEETRLTNVETKPTQDFNDPETEPAEITSLKLELSTLSTSYSSLQSTLVLLQTQLVDLKRVNNELQEENESYMILLREKTLSGQFDVMRQVGGDSSADEDEEDGYTDEDGKDSLRSMGRGTLDRVEEEITEETLERELERSNFEPRATDSPSRHGRHLGRHGRRHGSTSHSPTSRGESLADLPITGPGLDLAAELGRAENKDVLSGDLADDKERLGGKAKRTKKGSIDARRVPSDGHDNLPGDVDALRNEVKSLKDANKALSLYASKIIDRIISQEGFEHVLAVDFEKQPVTPKSAAPPESANAGPPTAKPRPQSTFFSRSASNPTPNPPPITTVQEKRSTIMSPPMSAVSPSPSTEISATTKASRRSLSFDWKSFSMFGGGERKENPSLRPLTLKPGAVPVTGRKLETYEDEDDRRERERLNATMKLMGIEPPTTPQVSAPPIQKSVSTPINSPVQQQPSRFSFFRSRSATESDATSVHSAPSLNGSRVGLGVQTPGLTQEALEQVEAENSLAALDAHEQVLSAEMAKGAGSGFTDIVPRRASEGRRSRRSGVSGQGSGSTVWSAGMSGEGDMGEE